MDRPTGQERKRSDSSGPNNSYIYIIGEQLRERLHNCNPPLIQNRRHRLKSYKSCFIGKDVIDWLLRHKEAPDRETAVKLIRVLQQFYVIRHVTDAHLFKDEYLFYRFRKDDNTFPKTRDTSIYLRGDKLLHRLLKSGSIHPIIGDRENNGKKYLKCFIAKDVIDLLVKEREVKSRQQALLLCNELLEHGLIRCVTGEDHSKMKSQLSLPKDLHMRRHSSPMPLHYHDNNLNLEDVFMENVKLGTSYGSTESDDDSLKRLSYEDSTSGSPKSPSSLLGLPGILDIVAPDGKYGRKDLRIRSDDVGFGFVVRGTSPIYVHTVDPAGPAAAAGLKVGQYIATVNSVNVLHMDHTEAARIIVKVPNVVNLTVLEKN
ncbi:DEP domain-containing mTOR-interacting protein-like [Saccoglossus kowalevskii]